MILEDINSLNVLYKALFSLKFRRNDDAIEEIIYSPFYNELMMGVREELIALSKQKKFIVHSSTLKIEDYPNDLDIIKSYISNNDYFHSLNSNEKMEFVKNVSLPYSIDSNTVESLIIAMKRGF